MCLSVDTRIFVCMYIIYVGSKHSWKPFFPQLINQQRESNAVQMRLAAHIAPLSGHAEEVTTFCHMLTALGKNMDRYNWDIFSTKVLAYAKYMRHNPFKPPAENQPQEDPSTSPRYSTPLPNRSMTRIPAQRPPSQHEPSQEAPPDVRAEATSSPTYGRELPQPCTPSMVK